MLWTAWVGLLPVTACHAAGGDTWAGAVTAELRLFACQLCMSVCDAPNLDSKGLQGSAEQTGIMRPAHQSSHGPAQLALPAFAACSSLPVPSGDALDACFCMQRPLLSVLIGCTACMCLPAPSEAHCSCTSPCVGLHSLAHLMHKEVPAVALPGLEPGVTHHHNCR